MKIVVIILLLIPKIKNNWNNPFYYFCWDDRKDSIVFEYLLFLPFFCKKTFEVSFKSLGNLSFKKMTCFNSFYSIIQSSPAVCTLGNSKKSILHCSVWAFYSNFTISHTDITSYEQEISWPSFKKALVQKNRLAFTAIRC